MADRLFKRLSVRKAWHVFVNVVRHIRRVGWKHFWNDIFTSFFDDRMLGWMNFRWEHLSRRWKDANFRARMAMFSRSFPMHRLIPPFFIKNLSQY